MVKPIDPHTYIDDKTLTTRSGRDTEKASVAFNKTNPSEQGKDTYAEQLPDYKPKLSPKHSLGNPYLAQAIDSQTNLDLDEVGDKLSTFNSDLTQVEKELDMLKGDATLASLRLDVANAQLQSMIFKVKYLQTQGRYKEIAALEESFTKVRKEFHEALSKLEIMHQEFQVYFAKHRQV